MISKEIKIKALNELIHLATEAKSLSEGGTFFMCLAAQDFSYISLEFNVHSLMTLIPELHNLRPLWNKDQEINFNYSKFAAWHVESGNNDETEFTTINYKIEALNTAIKILSK